MGDTSSEQTRMGAISEGAQLARMASQRAVWVSRPWARHRSPWEALCRAEAGGQLCRAGRGWRWTSVPGGGCRDDFSRWALGSAPSRDMTFINTQP